MCSSVGDRTCLLPGFPIRKSSDQSSVDSSPRLIAASYVLHRLLVPRHPPCALNNLTTQTPTPTHNKAPDPHNGKPGALQFWVNADIQIHAYKNLLDARVHCAVLKVRKMTAHPTPPDPGHPGGTTPERSLTRRNTQPFRAAPFPQDPTACLRPAFLAPPRSPPPRRTAVLAATPGHRPNWSA